MLCSVEGARAQPDTVRGAHLCLPPPREWHRRHREERWCVRMGRGGLACYVYSTSREHSPSEVYRAGIPPVRWRHGRPRQRGERRRVSLGRGSLSCVWSARGPERVRMRMPETSSIAAEGPPSSRITSALTPSFDFWLAHGAHGITCLRSLQQLQRADARICGAHACSVHVTKWTEHRKPCVRHMVR